MILKACNEARRLGQSAPVLSAGDVDCLEHEIRALRDGLLELAFLRGTIEGLQANAKAARDLLGFAVDKFATQSFEEAYVAVASAMGHLRGKI